MLSGISNKLVLLLVSATLAGCGAFNIGGSGNSSIGSGDSFGGKRSQNTNASTVNAKKGTSDQFPKTLAENRAGLGQGQLNLADFLNPANDNADIRVNKYLWEATLETLSFLPLEAADPFSGVVVMGWGRAPGSNTDFRATILIQDPALEAGSLKVAMQKRRGPASAETNRRIEDAILTRARQLRIRAAKRR